MKKVLIASLALLLLTGCGNTITYTDEEEQTDYTTVIEELKEMSVGEIKTYCLDNEIPLQTVYEESDEVLAEELIRIENNVDELSGSEILTLVLSSGHKTLVVPNSMGLDKNSIDTTVESLKSNYKVYDYEYKYEDGCEEDDSCIVVEQSIMNTLIKEPTVITYTFGKDLSKFGYVDPIKYLGMAENSFVEALKELGFENLKNIGSVYSNLPKGTICYYLPDGTREYTDVIEYKVSLGPKPKPVTLPVSTSQPETQNNSVAESTTEPKPQPESVSTPELPPINIEPIPDEDYEPSNGGGSIEVFIPVPTPEELENAPDPPEGVIVYG